MVDEYDEWHDNRQPPGPPDSSTGVIVWLAGAIGAGVMALLTFAAHWLGWLR